MNHRYLVLNDDRTWEEMYYMQTLRKRAGMVQSGVGAKIKHSTSLISKMENTKPSAWKLSEIIEYASACGYDTEVRFVKRSEEVREEDNDEREVHQH